MKNNTKSKTFQHLTSIEREKISLLWNNGIKNYSQIALEVNRHRSTVYREIQRNNSRKCDLSYSCVKAEEKYSNRWHLTHQKKWISNDKTKNYIKKYLMRGWSPEQISGRMKLLNRKDSVSHESIYQLIYTEKNNWIKYLAKSHRIRKKRGHKPKSRRVIIKNKVMISERPDIINNRKEFGHWEADTAVSRNSKSVLMVLVERVCLLTKINRLENKKASSMRIGIINRLKNITQKARQSITFDNGTENAQHERMKDNLNLETYFCNPYHSWEKGTVENTIGLIRQYWPKKTDFSKLTNEEINAVEKLLNTRPRKKLGYKTPIEAYREMMDNVAFNP